MLPSHAPHRDHCRVFIMSRLLLFFFFFFNDTATTEIYTLSLHDALPISPGRGGDHAARRARRHDDAHGRHRDRKSTRLNSSHGYISYAVFCLKKKKKKRTTPTNRRKPPAAPRMVLRQTSP